MRRILVVNDPADREAIALARGCQLADQACADLRVLELRRAEGARPKGSLQRRFRSTLDNVRRDHPCVGTITIGVGAATAAAIAGVAGDFRPDLIVMRNMIASDVRDDRPFATIADVLRRTGLPVLAVQNRVLAPYRSVVALVDQGPIAEQTLDLALSIKSAGAVYAVHTSLPESAGVKAERAALGALTEHVRATRTDCASVITPMQRTGDLDEQIVRVWEEVQGDLLVAVTHRRRGLRAWLGSSQVADMLEDLPFDLLVQEMPATAEDTRMAIPLG